MIIAHSRTTIIMTVTLSISDVERPLTVPPRKLETQCYAVECRYDHSDESPTKAKILLLLTADTSTLVLKR